MKLYGIKNCDKARVNNASSARSLMLAKPTVIRRPVLEIGDAVHIGFSAEAYERLLQ